MQIIFERKVKVAVVGCGHIAQKHIQAITAHANDLELVAVCDNNAEKLDSVASSLGIASYLDYEELLDKTDADIIVLCTPSGLHSSQTIKAASYGKHIITEKPMATRWHDGVAMVAACDNARVHLFVVKQSRYSPTLQLLKKTLQQGRFGKIYHININVYWTRPQSYYDQSRWRGTRDFDGGALMNQASHYVDLLTWLIGPVQNLQAMMATLGRKIEVEDTCVMNIQWRSGAIGSMNVTMLTYPKNLEASIVILGEHGVVKLGGVAANKIEHWQFSDHQIEDEQIESITEAATAACGFGHFQYYDNVVKTLRGEAEPDTSGREGLKSLEVLIAAYLSARDGQIVALPLEL